MNQTTEKIKIALLSIIAITLVVQTFYLVQDRPVQYGTQAEAAVTPESNMVAQNGMPNSFTPPQNQPQPQPESAPVPSGPATVIKFAETEHNFGKINQETDNKKIFKFTNSGTEPLTIQNAVGSCGCTVPTFPKEPIAPGKSGEIVVVYKPGQQKGAQTKTVTITANTEPTNTMLYIKADVQEKK